MPELSIIIPTLNEETALPVTLASLQSLRREGVEIIVVDGGSTDKTVCCTEGLVEQLVVSSAGRAVQLNKGAQVARGKVLLFLHADTLLAGRAIKKLLKQPKQSTLCWGRFKVKLDDTAIVFRIIETMMNWRSCLTGIVTGDHAMFVSKHLFEQVGGYPCIELMEDIAISKKLKKVSKPICLKETVTTSCRRWQVNGVVKTVLLMWSLRWAYFFNAEPKVLAQKYRQIRIK